MWRTLILHCWKDLLYSSPLDSFREEQTLPGIKLAWYISMFQVLVYALEINMHCWTVAEFSVLLRGETFLGSVWSPARYLPFLHWREPQAGDWLSGWIRNCYTPWKTTGHSHCVCLYFGDLIEIPRSFFSCTLDFFPFHSSVAVSEFAELLPS